MAEPFSRSRTGSDSPSFPASAHHNSPLRAASPSPRNAPKYLISPLHERDHLLRGDPSLTSWKNRLAGPRLPGACAGVPDSRTLTLLGGKATAARAPVRSGRAERDQPARSVEPRGLGRPVVRVRGFGIAPPLLPTVGRSAAQNIGGLPYFAPRISLSSRPSRTASSAAAIRLGTPSFLRIADTW